MNELFTESVAPNLLGLVFFGPLGLCMVWAVLRTLDKLNGTPFGRPLERILEDPKATARYYGARYLGSCILVGLVILKSI